MSQQQHPQIKPEPSRWTIDKHIPVALILTMLGQLVYIVWWGSGVQFTVQDHERRLLAQETAKVAERMAIVENQLRNTQELQKEMKKEVNEKLDYLINRQTRTDGGAR